MHVKRQIKEAVRTALLDKTDAGRNVYVDRDVPIRDGGETDSFPFINITSPAESAELETSTTLERVASIVIDVEARSSEGTIGAQLDDLQEQIELQLPDRLAPAKRFILESAAQEEPSLETDASYGLLELTYLAFYYTQPGNPTEAC